MTAFKTRGIILKIDKAGPKENIYTIFSYDFGKIRCNKVLSKKEKNLDLGYVINSEIRVNQKTDIQKISNIKISSEFVSQNKNFEEINAFLELLNIVYKNIPEGNPFYKVFHILETIIKEEEKCSIEKIILAKLKILNLLGTLKQEHDNKTIEKILKFIGNSKIETIIKLTGINSQTLEALKNIN